MSNIQNVEQFNVYQAFSARKSLQITAQIALMGGKRIFLARTNNGRGA